jgi:hypothetical protein
VSRPDVLVEIDRALADHFGQVPARAALSFVGVQPIEVLRFEPVPGELAYLSLGMARGPMTSASEPAVAASGPRAELMLHVRAAGERFQDVWRQLAVLAAAPVVEGVVYVDGMTVDVGQPLAAQSRCSGAVVVPSPLAPIDTDAGPVAVLQLIPATSTELAWCRVHGAASLRERWSQARTDLLDLGRPAVGLD